MTPSAKTAGGRRVRRWTRELIIEKILEWEARYGEPPCSADWNPSLARWRAQEWRAERYREGVWPSDQRRQAPVRRLLRRCRARRGAGAAPSGPAPRRPARRGLMSSSARRRATRRGGPSPGRRRAGACSRALERAAARRRGPGRACRGEGERRAPPCAPRDRSAAPARRERVRVARRDARTEALERVEELIADADARVRASDDQAEAAVRDAAEARVPRRRRPSAARAS